MGRDDEIGLMAYSIWEREGCPNGKDCEHWLAAEATWVDQHEQSDVSVVGGSKTAVKKVKNVPMKAKKS